MMSLNTDHLGALLSCLLLLVATNGAPIIAWKLLGDRMNLPLDGGLLFADGRPLLGASKTIRGVLAGIGTAILFAPVAGIPLASGAAAGLLSMLGDLASSFIKRRAGLNPSDRWLGVDQIPESLLPMLFLKRELNLDYWDVSLTVLAFFLSEVLLSRMLYPLSIRNRPY